MARKFTPATKARFKAIREHYIKHRQSAAGKEIDVIWKVASLALDCAADHDATAKIIASLEEKLTAYTKNAKEN